jgi:hypothetical protein
VAYRAEIEIVAKGVAKVTQLQKDLKQLANQIDHLNGPGSLGDFNRQLAEATKLLSSAQQGTVEEKRAVDKYVTALKNANGAQERTNRLIAEEIKQRDGATSALKRYNAAAASGRQPGGSMAGRYLRPGSAVATTQSAVPFGPAPGAQFGSTTQFGPVGGPSSSILGGQSSPVGDRIERSVRAARELDKVYESIDRIAAKSVATENERVEALGKGTQEVVELANSYRDITGQAKTQKQLQNEIRRKILETKKAASEEARVRSRDYLERLRLAEGLGQERRNALLLASREEETERRINAVLERRRKQQEQLAATQKRRQRFSEDLALGAGFPLLFGGGAGAVLGGVAGAVAGGGKGGFGLQILLSAIGQQFDQLAQSAKELGQALSPLTADIEKVLEAAGTAGTESAELARRLQEAGEEQLALAVATDDLARVVGLDGVDALREFGSETSELNKAINKLVLDVQVGIAKLANAAIQLTGTTEQRQVRESVEQARGLIRSGKASPELVAAFEKRTSGTDITGAFGAITQTERDIVRLVKEANEERINGLRIEAERAEQSKEVDRLAQRAAKSDASFESFNRQIQIFELGNSLLNERVVALKEEDIIARGNADTQALALELDKVRGNFAAEEQLRSEIQARNAQTNLQLSQLKLSVQQAVTAEAEKTTQAEQRLLRIQERKEELAQRELQRAEQLRERQETREAEVKGNVILNLSNQLELQRAIGSGNEEQVRQQQQIDELVKRTNDEGMRPIIESYMEQIRAQKEVNREAEKTREVYDKIGSAVRDGLVDGIMSAIDGTKSLSESLSGVLKQLGRMFLTAGIGSFNVGGKGGSGLLGLIPGLANGGPATAGRPYVVGERGPELFVPNRSGTVVPNGAMGGASVTVNVDASGSAVEGSGDEAGQLGKAIGVAVQQELIKQKRPGGLLA